jgi:hypothetical protein
LPVELANVALAVGPALVVATAGSLTAIKLQQARLKHEREVADDKLRNERRVADIAVVRATLIRGVELTRKIEVWSRQHFDEAGNARARKQPTGMAITEPGSAIRAEWFVYLAELEILFGEGTDVYDIAATLPDVAGEFNMMGPAYSGGGDVDFEGQRQVLLEHLERWRAVARSLARATT